MTTVQPARSPSPIRILLGFDRNFWAPAYATMRSICLASPNPENIVFHLCYRGLDDEQKADLGEISKEFGAGLSWHDLDTNPRFQAALATLKDSKRLGTIIYARLMVEEFVPADAERVIYLDCDVMVMAPIEELWDTPLNGRTLGAVRDPWVLLHVRGRDMRDKKDLFRSHDPYFNSGLMVIDLERWRAAKVWDKLKAVIADGTMERLYYDQDFLNLTFRGDWTALDQLWNVIDPRPAHAALNPKLLHYTGDKKPWNIWSGVAFERIYRHVMTNELFYRYWRFRTKRRLKSLLPFGKRG